MPNVRFSLPTWHLPQNKIRVNALFAYRATFSAFPFYGLVGAAFQLAKNYGFEAAVAATQRRGCVPFSAKSTVVR